MDKSWRHNDSFLFISLALFALLVRLGTLMPIHTGVDERDYWNSAKAIAHGLPYPDLSHRTVRFSVIIPTAAAQILLGSGPNVYYVLPVLNSMAQAILLYLIGRKLRGKVVGFLSALGITLFPYMIRAGSQVRPEIFSVTLMAAAVLVLLYYLEAERKPYRHLTALGGLLFLAYEAKVTNLFFLPGIVLAVFLARKNLKHVLVLGVVPFALFLIETLLYRIFTQYPFGQLQVILANHIEGNSALKQMRFLDLFKRYAEPYLQIYWQLPFVLFAIALVWSVVKKKHRQALLGLGLPALSFFFFITLAVAGFDPIVPAEPFINRYFSAVLVCVIPFLVLLFADLAEKSVGSNWLKHLDDSKIMLPLTLASLVVIGFLVSIFVHLPPSLRQYLPSPLRSADHPLAMNREYFKMVTQAWDEGIPIAGAAQKDHSVGGMNAVLSCASYFLDYTRYPGGTLPPVRKVAVHGATLNILAKETVVPVAKDPLLMAIRNPIRLSRGTFYKAAVGLKAEAFPK